MLPKSISSPSSSMNHDFSSSCITTRDEFCNKYSFVYKEINPKDGSDIGRIFKVRKDISDENNTIVAFNKNAVENYISMDYYIQRLNKKRGILSEEYDSYEKLFPSLYKDEMSYLKKPHFPKPGDKLTLKSVLKHPSDDESVDIFEAIVLETYPFVTRFGSLNNIISTEYSRNFGLVHCKVDITEYKPKRAISLPPIYPKHLVPNFNFS